MRLFGPIFALLLVASAAACSGTGSVAVGPSSTSSPRRVASVTIVIRVPVAPPPSAATKRRPAYLSSGTQSIVVAINGAVVTTANTTATSPSCAPVTGAIQCTIETSAPIGSDRFAVTSYDRADGAGDILSSGTTTSTIVMNAANMVKLTLAGVVASVSMSIPPIPTCTATAVPLTVHALDAAGFTIVGTLPYDVPIALSLENAKNSSATSLTGTTVSKPGDGATITYNGGYEPGSTITASGAGFTSTYTVFPTPTVCNQYPIVTTTFPHINGITLGSDGNLYVGSYNTHQMLRIAPSGATIGKAVPIAITTGPTGSVPGNSAEPLQAINGPDGNLWIADGANAIDELGVPAIAVQNNYGAGTYQESAVAVGPDKRLWYTDFRRSDLQAVTIAGVLTSYPYTPSANARDPKGIVGGPDGNMWFTLDATIATMKTDGTGYAEYAVPTTTSATNATPQDIVVGGDGNLWFDDRTQDAIGRITTSGTITMFPIPDAGSGVVYGLTTGPDGNIWFVGENDTLHGYFGRATLSGVLTQYPIPGTSYPTGPLQITVSPDNNLWFTETYQGTASDGQVGYAVI